MVSEAELSVSVEVISFIGAIALLLQGSLGLLSLGLVSFKQVLQYVLSTMLH